MARALSLALRDATIVGISGQDFTINGAVTYQGRTSVSLESGGTADIEGLLLNARMINAVFDDEDGTEALNWDYPSGPAEAWNPTRNTAEFVAQFPAYAAKGLLMVSVGLQGGIPADSSVVAEPPANITTAFNSNGTLKAAWLTRLASVIQAADRVGMVVKVQLYYQRQDTRLTNEAAILAGCDAIADWLAPYTNVLVSIMNEVGSTNWATHAIFENDRCDELITRIKTRQPHLLVGFHMRDPQMPTADMVTACDWIGLSANTITVAAFNTWIDDIRALASFTAEPKPILVLEDGPRPVAARMDAAMSKHVSYGYYDDGPSAGTYSNYVDGFQWVPANWAINTSAKTAFFNRCASYAGV